MKALSTRLAMPGSVDGHPFIFGDDNESETSDMANGNGGDNNLVGNGDDELLKGLGGNDTISGGDGEDTINGGDGNDWVSFVDATGGIVIDLQTSSGSPTNVDLVTFEENAAPALIGFGGADDSSLVVDPEDEDNLVAKVIKSATAESWAGTTVVTGDNNSIDTIGFTASSTTMTLRVWADEGVVVRLKVEDAADNERSCEVDAVTTEAGWQTLTFDFSEQAGGTAALNLEYTYNKASVFFNYGTSGADGGDGTFYFDDLTFVEAPAVTGTITDDGFGNTESVIATENVTGSAFADSIIGSSDANTLNGGDGKDTISGMGGDDALNGGKGDDLLKGSDGVDSLNGGGGSDTASFTGANVAAVVDLRVPDTAPALVSFEESVAPTLIGFGGADASSVVVDPENANNMVAQVIKSNTAETWAGTTVATGDNDSITEIGFTSDNTTMTLRVWTADAGVVVRLKVEDAGDNTHTCEVDAVSTKAGWQTLSFDFSEPATNDGNPTAPLNLDYTYNKASVFFNYGTSGANGGDGTFYFDDLFFEGAVPTGGTVANDGYGNAETITGIENLIGSSLADRFAGDGENNQLSGESGADTLAGNGGNDTLDGGSAADTLSGGSGNDSLIGGTAGDSLTGGTGNDTLAGGDGNDKLFGDDNVDALTGGAGNDQLDGGGSADSMTGGAGNDSYVVQNSGDKVVEALDGGTDTVKSSVAYTLAANVEKLTLTGSGDVNGIGNELDNLIVGNAGDNLLRGSVGADTLTGGLGDDIFRFSGSGNLNVDRITDFMGGDDIIQLENSLFTALSTTGVLKAGNFKASASGNASDSNDYVLYETDTGKLFYDADGNGSGAKLLIATLTDAPTLAATDIFVT